MENLTECNEALLKLNNSISELRAHIEECGCDEDPCKARSNGDINLGLHIGAVFIILFASLAGVMLPIAGRKLNLPAYPLILGKHFGTGIILCCALVHMLLPANESLTSKCLGSAFSEDYTAYAFLFCGISIFAMHSFERGFRLLMESTVEHQESPGEATADKEAPPSPPDQNAYGHDHRGISESSSDISATEIRVQAYMLEFGFTFHSIFIGLAVGVENENLVGLLIALSFHQFFEGVGLGSRLSEKGMNLCDAVVLGCIFAFSGPFGIMLGTVLMTQIQPGQPSFLLAQGIIDAICAGILLYVGFILLFHDFSRDIKLAFVGPRKKLRVAGLYLSMWSGAGLMAFIGRYL